MRVAAIVVTYNRLELLKECIDAIRNQTRKVDLIYVVNNGSTDGTIDYLQKQQDLKFINLSNNGCSWGFNHAFRLLINDFDFFWCMDDDTIPDLDCLQNLILPLESNVDFIATVGYIGSHIKWIDNTPHKMNVPFIKTHLNGIPFNYYHYYNLLLTEANSFVSVLFNAYAIKKCGLPIKEFFIWGDDQEFTSRMIMNGFLGFYSFKSVALHKTKSNYEVNVYNDDVANLWKYEFGVRNILFIKRQKSYFTYLISLLNHLSLYPLKVAFKRKKHRMAFSKVIFFSALRSVTFNPKIEYIEQN